MVTRRDLASLELSGRQAERWRRMCTGLDELEHWLEDAAQLGTAELYRQGEAYWEEQRARMVDAQLPGVAEWMDRICEQMRRPGWEEYMPEELGMLYLFARGLRRSEQLPAELTHSLRQMAGLYVRKADLLATQGIYDDWQVLGRRVVLQDRLDLQRTWLRGLETGRYLLLLEFAVGPQGFDTQFEAGQVWQGEAVFYPGACPLRGLLKSTQWAEEARVPAGKTDFFAFFQTYASALNEHPFLFQFPFRVEQLRPFCRSGHWYVADQTEHALPLHPDFHRHWDLLSISGGEPIGIFGEWDGRYLFPLAAELEGYWSPC